MTIQTEPTVREICQRYHRDRMLLMDIVREVQEKLGSVGGEALDLIARELSMPRVEVESVATFYTFYSLEPKGKVVIRLCDDVIDKMAGSEKVATALQKELGIGFNETTPDGRITLEQTACIGMCDQAPAALVNDVVVTKLTGASARELVKSLKKGTAPKKLVTKLGDGNNANPLVGAMVKNNIRKKGEVVFADFTNGAAIDKALALTPTEVIREVKTARLRGRGGAGFPTGMKWEYTRASPGERRYVLCNADEGEPGTFKDRVVLTECPDLMFEGMTIAGYAIGSDTGVIYLRGEYAYLKRYLDDLLEKRRAAGLLGKKIRGKDFDFDIRIQLGAGAYVCGEESALISSCEGLRGDPKTRPPFPAQRGYKGLPTAVNNVETFCCVSRIFEQGAGWFSGLGSKGSSGTKLLSISGDCKKPGVYEFPFGVKLSEVLEAAGAEKPIAVQVGGASGRMVGPSQYSRTICYDDLATGGSIMVFGPERNVLEVAHEFMRFFVHESCGFCTPCRVGNVLLKERLAAVLAGNGTAEDLDYLKELGETVKTTSRCGLGQTSPNPVLTTLEAFPAVYKKLLTKPKDGRRPTFDIHAALATAEEIAGRSSTIYERA